MRFYPAFTCFFLLLFFGCSQNPMMQDQLPDGKSGKKTPDYSAAFKKIDKLEKEGMYRQAMALADSITADARKHDAPADEVAALTRALNFLSDLEPNSAVKVVDRLQTEISNAEGWKKAVLQSQLANFYHNYFLHNEWQIRERTEIAGDQNGNFLTWPAAEFLQKSAQLYEASLSGQQSQTVPSKPLWRLVEGDTSLLRLIPTLFDLLAYRAFNFYSSSPGVIKPSFTVGPEVLLLNAPAFAAQSIPDSVAGDKAVKILRDITALHLENNQTAALIFANVQRYELAAQIHEKPNFPALESALLKELEKAGADPEYAAYFPVLANYYRQIPYRDDSLHLQKAVAVCEQAQQRYGGSYGAALCQSFRNDILQPSLQINAESLLPSAENLRLYLNYRNISTATIKVFNLSKEDQKSLEKDQESTLKKLKTRGNFLLEKQVMLPASGDHSSHSLETWLPARAVGDYLIVVEAASCEAWLHYQVSNLTAITSETEGEVIYLLANRQSGNPESGVRAEVFRQKHYNSNPELITSGTTTADGRVAFSLKTISGSSHIRFSKGDDLLEIRAYHHYYTREPKSKEPLVHTYTDRAIYRPGQQIFFKSILTDQSEKKPKPVAGYRLTAKLYDGNWQEIASLPLNTNEFGSVHGSFSIPLTAKTGQWFISVNNDRHAVQVEEYKRPTYFVKMDSLSGAFSIGDTIPVQGSTRRYNGSSADGTKVSYKVFASAFRYFWWYRPDVQRQLLHSGEVVSDANGKFDFSFIAKDPFQLAGANVRYEIEITAVDLRGEVQLATTEMIIGPKSVFLSADLPEVIFSTEPGKIPVFSKNSAGQTVPAALKIEVFKVPEEVACLRKQERQESEFSDIPQSAADSLFPHDPWHFSQEEALIGKRVSSFSVNTATDSVLALDKISALPEGKYLLKINSATDTAATAGFSGHFVLVNPKTTTAPTNDQFVVLPKKTAGRDGEKATVFIASACADQQILVEVERDKKITSRKVYTLSNAKKQLDFDILPADAADFAIHVTAMGLNRIYTKTLRIKVEHPERELRAKLTTHRNFLKPGAAETWTLGMRKDVEAEVLASMYDASLDQFRQQDWNFNVFGNYQPTLEWRPGDVYYYRYHGSFNCRYPERPPVEYRQIPVMRGVHRYPYATAEMVMSVSTDAGAVEDEFKFAQRDANAKRAAPDNASQPVVARQLVRKDFRETAFFYPVLHPDSNGEVQIKFTVPDALTTWKFRALVHTKDLYHSVVTREIESRKELMISANQPRFFRVDDEISFSAGLKNLTSEAIQATARITLFDPVTEEDVTAKYLNSASVQVSVPAGATSPVSWNLKIPATPGTVGIRVTAKSEMHTDGEEFIVPVLPNRMLVLETKPFVVTDSSKSVVFESFAQNSSPTLKNVAYTLEFTSNPAWYAVQALPYLLESDFESSEQLFSRFFANTMGAHILQSNPALANTLQSWKAASPEELLSNLEKNADLKTVLLSETPWVLQAEDDTQRKLRLAMLLDNNTLAAGQREILEKLQKVQNPDGSFSWFAGMQPDFRMTSYLVAGFGKLEQVGALNAEMAGPGKEMAGKAVEWLDSEAVEMYEQRMKNSDTTGISAGLLYYLYARSFYLDLPLSGKTQIAVQHFLEKSGENWLQRPLMVQAMLATTLKRFQKSGAEKILASLRDRAVQDPEKGMYWAATSGYGWFQRPVETQAALIEAFAEANASTGEIDNMRTWLLLQKRTRDWGNTKATVAACYALLMHGSNWLSGGQKPVVTVGDETFSYSKSGQVQKDLQANPGTGYFRKTWAASEIDPTLAKVQVENPAKSPAWGALYWQYLEDLNAIEAHEGPLNIKRSLNVLKVIDGREQLVPVSSEQEIQRGEEIVVRLVLSTDQAMNYVYLKDMRAAGFEPASTISAVHFRDGLVYYEANRDVATHFFISHLPAGTFVLEYKLKAEQRGVFSNGISTIQSLYAPEFSAHSEGVKVTIR